MIHSEPSPCAGKTVLIKDYNGQPNVEYRVEDWWDRVSGGSWMFAQGNPACMKYAIRGAAARLPIDDEVLYGKIGAFGELIHVTEITIKEGDDAN